MVEMIKNITGTQIVVGQNGIVWVRGENEDLAAEAILLIDQKSHIKGLTEYTKDFIEKTMEAKGIVKKEPIENLDENEEFEDAENDEFDPNENESESSE